MDEFNSSLSHKLSSDTSFIVTQNLMYLFFDTTQSVRWNTSNPACLQSPLRCSSYFFPGSYPTSRNGDDVTVPTLNLGTPYPSVLIANDIEGLQFDFWDNVDPSGDGFTENDCLALGNASTAVGLCIRASPLQENAVVAGSRQFLILIDSVRLCSLFKVPSAQCFVQWLSSFSSKPQLPRRQHLDP